MRKILYTHFPEYFDNKYADGGEMNAPKHWNELSMADKSDAIASAVRNGVTTLEDIRKAWDDYADSGYREDRGYREDSSYRGYRDNSENIEDMGNTLDGYDDGYQEETHEYLKGGYKPSAAIKNRIANWEGSSMQTNRSFDAEAKDFWNAIPSNVRSKLSQQQADALYSYSYNVGAGNFKKRVVPSLERYFNGNGSVEDVQRHMYATKDKDLRGLAKRRAVERAMFGGQRVEDVPSFNYDYSSNSSPYGHRFTVNNNFHTTGYLGPIVNGNSVNNDNTNKTNIFLQALEDEPKQTIVESTPEPRYNALERLQNIYSMYGMDDYAQEIGKYNPFGGMMLAKGGKKATVYKNIDGDYTTANGHPVEQIGWDANGYARFRDTVTEDIGKAYEPSEAYTKRLVNLSKLGKGEKPLEPVYPEFDLIGTGGVVKGLTELAADYAKKKAVQAIVKKSTEKPFTSELDWTPENWFGTRLTGGYDAEDIAALKAHIPEYNAIEEEAKRNGTWLKMPDGSTWEGDPRSWVQLQSKDGQKLLQKPLYHGNSNIYTNIDGNDVTPSTLGKGVLWTSSNKYLPLTYGNKHYTFAISKGTPMAEINAGGRNWNNLKGLNLGYESTNDVSWDLLNDDNVVKIKDVVDIGSDPRWRPGRNGLPQAVSNEDMTHYTDRVFKGDDYIFGEDIPRKSLLGNNGNFDFTESNIYKGLIPFALPIGIGYSLLNKN